MKTPLSVVLESLDCPPPESIHSLSGGCINQCYHLQYRQRDVVLKTRADPPAGFYSAEAAGLTAIAATGSVRVPAVLNCSDRGLLLEYLPPSTPDQACWQRFGEQLAALHRVPQSAFGFDQDNFCGLTPQPNPHYRDGYRFFAEQRLLYQANRALATGLLSGYEHERIETVCERLPGWIPEQPPSLIHGDLWQGNFYCSNGQPVLLDPAAYWGWAEADLAMSCLFGGFDPGFYESYQDNSGIELHWRDRTGLYNLYHLLNHLNLFGRGYLPSIRSILGSYLD